ncbi:MAG: hypothetical protein VKM92_04550 [Cyanobacteriota bacterium]|nr:hypothetical protein [Cyanobacteriota bacterium]
MNLALNGDWNVYRFDAYRDAQVQEPSVTSLPFAITVQPQIEHQAARTELVVYPCLPSHLARADRLDVGLTAVLEHVDATLSYWALTHPAAQPDFHDRRGWVLRL